MEVKIIWYRCVLELCALNHSIRYHDKARSSNTSVNHHRFQGLLIIFKSQFKTLRIEVLDEPLNHVNKGIRTGRHRVDRMTIVGIQGQFHRDTTGKQRLVQFEALLWRHATILSPQSDQQRCANLVRVAQWTLCPHTCKNLGVRQFAVSIAMTGFEIDPVRNVAGTVMGSQVNHGIATAGYFVEARILPWNGRRFSYIIFKQQLQQEKNQKRSLFCNTQWDSITSPIWIKMKHYHPWIHNLS